MFALRCMAVLGFAALSLADYAVDIPVEIDVQCRGLDFGGNQAAIDFSSEALTAAYNGVNHIDMNGGGRLGEAEYVSSSSSSLYLRQSAAKYRYSALWHCAICGSDDDAVDLAKSAMAVAWEEEFAHRLTVSELFDRVSDCSIDMRYSSNEIA